MPNAKLPKEKTNHASTIAAVNTVTANTIASLTKADITDWHVCVSGGNSKMGEDCPNVSLPPVFSCHGVCGECAKYCYAVTKYCMQGIHDSRILNNKWFRNMAIYTLDPERYFAEIDAAISSRKKSFFRWHVGGEIPNRGYFIGMNAIAIKNPDVRFLCFTKRYDIVNTCLENIKLPQNLKVLFSAAPNTKMENPFHLPESHVAFEDSSKNTCHHPESMVWHCPGSCDVCRCAGAGCWFMENGAAVIINQH